MLKNKNNFKGSFTMSKKIQIFLFAFTIMFGAQNAHAQCTGPASSEGGIDYSTTINDLIVCDGTNWQTAGYTGGGSGLFTDNTTHISREGFHIIDAGQTTTSTGFDLDGVRGFYHSDKGSFRGGSISGSNDAWQEANIGLWSFSWGLNSQASGGYSIALGNNANATGNSSFAAANSTASGSNSVAMGNSLSSGSASTALASGRAEGNLSTAIGQGTNSFGFRSIAIGSEVTAGNFTAQTNNSNTGVGNYSMAFGLGDSGATSFSFPRLTGNESVAFFFGNQSSANIAATNVLALEGGSLLLSNDSGTACAANKAGALRLNTTADGLEMCDGTSTWNAFPAAGGSGLFTDNTTHITRENFHIIDAGQNSTTAGLDGTGTRMFFDPNKGALRGGVNIGGDSWQNSRIGSGSFAWGRSAEASGSYSLASGDGTSASAPASVALGYDVGTRGTRSFAMGLASYSFGYNSFALGNRTQTGTGTGQTTNSNSGVGNHSFSFGVGSATSGFRSRVSANESVAFFFGDQSGEDITATNVLALEGGSLLLSNDSGTACAANKAGALRLNAAANGLEMCDGTSAWNAFPTAGGSGLWTAGTGDSIYYNTGTSPFVGIGINNPTEKLHVNGNIIADAYLHTSDQNLKNDIKIVSGLDLITKLRGVTFSYKEDGRLSAGIIAQDLQKVLPRAVHQNDSGFLTVDYNQLFAPIIESIKDLHKMVQDLSEKIKSIFDKVTALENENAALQSEVKMLKKQNQDILNRLDALEISPQTSSSDLSSQPAT